MVRVCAWCERYLGVKDSETISITHGICAPCLTRQEWADAPTLILSREREPLLPLFRSLLRGAPEIQIIVDRRVAQRRRGCPEPAPPPGAPRRGSDRRQRIDLALV
jgi:hypothetical protein